MEAYLKRGLIKGLELKSIMVHIEKSGKEDSKERDWMRFSLWIVQVCPFFARFCRNNSKI